MDRLSRITVTGGKGFLGQHLIEKLKSRGYQNISIADLPEYNLVDVKGVHKMYAELKPQIVIHLAARVGGIGFNQANPATLFYENAMMGIQLMHEAYSHQVEKFVALGTICAYPKFTPTPFREDDIWNGYPEETNAPYGLAKKMMLVQSQAYRQQYGFNSIFLMPVNLYGPGDNFSFRSSHVIPALIRKFHLANLLSSGNFTAIRRDFIRNGDGQIEIESKEFSVRDDSPDENLLTILHNYGISFGQQFLSDVSVHTKKPNKREKEVVVEIWGTGQATREFFYVEDAAEAIVLAAEQYNKSEPVNIGAGFEISIRELVGVLSGLIGFTGRVEWNTSKPDGQPRRMLDTRKAVQEFGFKSSTGFEEGLRKTIDWYKSQK